MSDLAVRRDPPGGPERRTALTEEIVAATGIDEAMIERLVHRFYDRVRQDPLLGPVFAARIADWPAHLGRMCAFWSSVALLTGRYRGAPVPAHLPLPVDAGHFDRWLALFRDTAAETCPPPAAAHFIERAERIAASLELGIATAQGVALRRGERYWRPGPDRSADAR